MGGMTTFGNNDSVFSHGEDSISMLNRLAEIAKEVYKYIPENDCTVACGTFVDVDTHAFLSAVQHFRESIEAYRDLTEELDDDLRKCRTEYEHDMDCILHMYPKTTINNPQNFCGNCKHFVTQPCDIAICNNKHADPFIVDPDDASCSHFESNQVDRDKPDQPCCKECNREDCNNCTLCPF